ncbi:AraC family transcriptional regulator [Agrobacterium sp. OT33]|uniref:AraC family transcriptional regulator n=1 Tax=Agrobacterium sp. OT33 TaxID=2815338 RepID=UPI001A8D7173|nr:AraC family transcriptional regulator [Agrobacterium sp. OT33]MBO0129050.1 AraC family transcriptional regulator [Agrobacterium sp. OT33]
MDPLSNALSLLKPKGTLTVGLDAGGDWAISFPAHEGVKFNAVIKGSCWLMVEGEAEPRRIEAGDCVLFTRGYPFVAANNLGLPAMGAASIYEGAKNGMATCNGGGDFHLIGGRFSFEQDRFDHLFASLPSVLHIRGDVREASVLRWSLEQLAVELAQNSPGSSLMAEHLAHIMLLQVLRLWLESSVDQTGWLGALADVRLFRAIAGMHAEPARRWTVADLAGLASMSRTTFAVRFRDVVGQTPLGYLTNWRMQLAADLLQSTESDVRKIAFSVGYLSEAAFSTVFRRALGYTPAQYRRAKSAALTSRDLNGLR